jgi:hypothetical protein
MAVKKQKSIELSEPLLARTFGLNRVFEPTPLLKEWFAATGYISEIDIALLEKVRVNLLENTDFWNEEELKMHFISIVILIANFEKPLKVYFDREISAVINGILVKTEADMLVSKGIGDIIETPYFFLHEYKREKKYTGDPTGQMLGGMLIAQSKNQDEKPVFGCYVQGRYWYFSILQDKEYIISNSFNSTELEEAKHIILILREVKKLVGK